MDQRNLKETINTYNESAHEYQDRFMELKLYHDTYDKFCSLILKKNARILEIACGPGNVTKYLLSKRPDFKFLGIDLAPNMIKLAKSNNPTAEFQVMNGKEINKLQGKFDAIICAFGMPYFSKEEVAVLIKNVSDLLVPNGIFYFSTMEDDYHKSGFEPTSFSGNNKVFIYYHQKDYLEKQIQLHGFQTLDFKRKFCPEPNGTFFTDMIFTVKNTLIK